MIEPRAPERSRWNDLFRLLNQVLRPGLPATIRDEYPLMFREENMGNLRVVVEDDRIVSHVGFLPVDFHVDGVDMHLGLLGSVATDEAYRGRGLATACLNAAEQAVRDDGGSVSILWADDRAFYERQGYVRAGREDLFVIPTRLLRRRNDRSGIRPATPGDADRLANVHGTLRARTIRPPRDWKLLLKTPRMLTLVYERDRRVVAYACCGKGADFEGVVHEWAGPTEEALDLVLEQSLRCERDEVVLLSPPYTGRIRRTLRERGLPAHRGALGMMKIVDPEGFVAMLNRFFEPDTSPACRFRVAVGGGYEVEGPSGTLELDAAQMLRLAFGSEEDDEFRIPGLPIPLYLRGLDSI
jgi:GNAT superfamily N-acetyltransferase